MFDTVKEFLLNFFKSRLVVLAAFMILLFGVLIQRVFFLQIVNGEEYQNNYTLQIKKERELKSTRGNIYDRNGNLLAKNELAYTLTIEDNGSYANSKEKNKSINEQLSQIIKKLDQNGDTIDNSFEIVLNPNGSYEYNVKGKALKRFLADVYGHSSIDALEYNDKLKYDEGKASASQVMDYLQGSSKFGVSKKYDKDMAYRITVIRYAMSENSYQKYIATTIATDISEETVAYISENSDKLQGVSIADDTIRKYMDSTYFAQIIGYTGKISQEEYDNLSKKSKDYTLTDVIGKSGIEQYMDLQLQGKKGSETVYVDNLGKVVETKDRVEPIAGGNVYLSINADWSKTIYDLLEAEIAGIVYNQIENIKEYKAASGSSASDIKIPIDDVYFALINNNIINTEHFKSPDASATEQAVLSAFTAKQSAVLEQMRGELSSADAKPFAELEEEIQDYITYIISMLKDYDVLVTDKIEKTDETYLAWADGTISLNEYLNHAIAQNWIDITRFTVDEKYADSSEIYQALLAFINDELAEDIDFSKIIYKYMISQNAINGTQLCLILYDQDVLAEDDAQMAALSAGTVSPYNFLREKVRNLEITPAQLALDPCSGSCVITDVNTGELLAVVSYPGYDNNRLANSVDADYYAKLTNDLSNPLYNYATQERTAPGSTFKIVSATAGLSEGVITTSEKILAEGEFRKVTPSPKCWIYPSSHGLINVSEAIRDSCNYFFSEIGYRLSSNGDTYNEEKGVKAIQKYAKMYGFGDTTGIEIPENKPQIADKQPLWAAFGQSNHNYTTTQLSRYITAVANSGTVYNYTLLKKVTDANNNVTETYEPSVKNTVDVLDAQEWDNIHSGMRMVVEDLDVYRDFPINVAGKTGTAQQIVTRPNHALFVGYAPYENPQLSIAVRIAHGYTSHNSAAVAKEILSYCLGVQSKEELIDGKANEVEGNSNSIND